MPNILSNKLVKTNADSNIFFVETTGSVKSQNNALASLNNRQACSIESAAFTNPNAKVFVIFTEQTTMKRSEIFDALRKYKNIFFLRMELKELSKGTIASKFVASKSIYDDATIKEDISDLVKLLLLSRFEEFSLKV